MEILKKQRGAQGFTIIEVMIVLAIAAVIMLIVFLAVPALQRNSRNTQRNDDAARVATAVNECLANRNGLVASCMSTGSNNVPVDPTTDFSQLNGAVSFSTTCAVGTPGGNPGSTSAASVCYNRTCTSDGAGVAAGSSSKQFIVRWQNENNVQRCFTS